MRELSATEDCARRLDTADPLVGFRRRFYHLPDKIYMDGNSLGLLCREAEACVQRVVEEWKTRGIDGWLEPDRPWFTLGERLGSMTAPLLGAGPDEVCITGSTTVNLHTLLGTFYRPEADRCRLLADELNFPSDIYAMTGHLRLRGRDPVTHLRLASSRDGLTLEEDDLIAAMGEGVALAVLPAVLFRSGQLLDMERLTRAAHERGILIGFDCSHSVGVVPHEFDRWGVDFAFWCTYKYLNAGPGATAGLYVNRRHFGSWPGLAGWWGYVKERQFDMRLEFEPAPSAGGWQIGSIPVLSTAPLEGALRVTLEAGMDAVRAKSDQLTTYLIFLADELLAGPEHGFRVATPREPGRRGGHVALMHREAGGIYQALKARGVIGDLRPPNIIRLAPAPLYTSFCEVWRVVQHLREIVEGREYEGRATQ